jgi:hypothetical protein
VSRKKENARKHVWPNVLTVAVHKTCARSRSPASTCVTPITLCGHQRHLWPSVAQSMRPHEDTSTPWPHATHRNSHTPRPATHTRKKKRGNNACTEADHNTRTMRPTACTAGMGGTHSRRTTSFPSKLSRVVPMKIELPPARGDATAHTHACSRGGWERVSRYLRATTAMGQLGSTE